MFFWRLIAYTAVYMFLPGEYNAWHHALFVAGCETAYQIASGIRKARTTDHGGPNE